MSSKPLASLSLDLDNKWSYLKTHGDPNWDSYPSYLDLVTPRFLDFMSNHRQKMTVFVVGQDAELEKNKAPLNWIVQDDHEIGNHSFLHEPWMHRYTPTQIQDEFSRTEKAIKNAVGVTPVGFRGPGYTYSDEVLRTLIQRGYEYDCSTFPTYLGPLARAYYFMTARFSSDQKQERKSMFGTLKDGLQSNRPYHWVEGPNKLVEIPVTTFPIFKVPIHASYLVFLARVSPLLAKSYFWSAVKLARLTGIGPSFLLHPLDFLGPEDDDDLSFFPGMDVPATIKIDLLNSVLNSLNGSFELVTMRDHAHALRERDLRQRPIDTATKCMVSSLQSE